MVTLILSDLRFVGPSFATSETSDPPEGLASSLES